MGCGRGRQFVLRLGGLVGGGSAAMTCHWWWQGAMVGYVGKWANVGRPCAQLLGFGFGGLGNDRFAGLWLWEVLLT